MFRFACHRLLTLRSNRISIRARSSAHGTLNVNEYAVTLCSLAEDAVRVRAGRNFHFHLSLPFFVSTHEEGLPEGSRIQNERAHRRPGYRYR